MPSISRKIGTFTKKEIAELFKNAKRMRRSPYVDILCAPVTDRDFGKILVITSKKVGKAHKRNLIKRRLRSIFYEEKLYKHLYDCIIIIKKEALTCKFDQLKLILQESIPGRKQYAGV